MRAGWNPLRRRPGQSWEQRADAYLLLGPVLALPWMLPLGTLYLGGVFSRFFLLGLPCVVGAQLLLRPVGRLERFLLSRLLGATVPPPAPLGYERSSGSWSSVPVDLLRRSYASFQDAHSWRVLLWTLIRCFTGPLGTVLVVVRVVRPVMVAVMVLIVLVDTFVTAVDVETSPRDWYLTVPLLLVLLLPLRRVTNGLSAAHERLAGWALGPGAREIEAAALARASRAEEQVRIDQELHDSIGHMLSMIVVQAGAGAHVFERDPQFALRALRTIEQRGRAALGELDRIIADLRGTAAGEHAPLPDGDDLPALLAGAREAGMEVASRIRAGDLPPVIGRGVYRIVQEALTNAAKHAPGAAVSVDVAVGTLGAGTLGAGPLAVAVSVENAVPGRAPAVPGRGLASIRDRAALLGGAATAGRTADGRFAVRALVPLGGTLPDGAGTPCDLTPGCRCAGCDLRRSVLG